MLKAENYECEDQQMSWNHNKPSKNDHRAAYLDTSAGWKTADW